jgi:hypothetical protein
MSQLFPRSANALVRASLVGVVLLVGALGSVGWTLAHSGFITGQGVTVPQTVPFSHDHHVSGLGIDCRYCHTGVETSSFAGIPPTATCYNCHKIIWKDAPMLEPVRESFRTGKPLVWNRVHDLPDFVYFDHSIHVAKGVGCASCHGRIDQMKLVRQDQSLQMAWCLDCHRNPEKLLRPKSEIFNLTWEAKDQRSLGERLAKEYHLRPTFALTNCSTCHR